MAFMPLQLASDQISPTITQATIFGTRHAEWPAKLEDVRLGCLELRMVQMRAALRAPALPVEDAFTRLPEHSTTSGDQAHNGTAKLKLHNVVSHPVSHQVPYLPPIRLIAFLPHPLLLSIVLVTTAHSACLKS